MSTGLDQEIESRILAEVDKAFDAQVEFLSNLVREPSLWGKEQGAQEVMYANLAEANLNPMRQQVTEELLNSVPEAPRTAAVVEGSYNVLGHKAGSGGGRSLVLNGHIDVVPAETSDRWTRAPFDPYVKDGWLYGRGSGDMKAGLAANVYAVRALNKAGVSLQGDIRLQSVIEEECTGHGALACVAAGGKADAVLISEPAHGYLPLAQVGIMWVGVQVDGIPAHAGAMLETGHNAIEAAYKIWDRVKLLKDRWNARSAEYPPLTAEINPVNFVIGTINGGDWPSSVPSRCNFEFRCGVLPGQSLEDAKLEIEREVAKAAEELGLTDTPPVVSYPGLMAEGYVLQPCDDFRDCLIAAHEQTSEIPLQPIVSPAGSDCRFFGNYAKTPALMYGPKAQRIHGIDECVELESLRQVTKAIALFAASWCGIDKGED
ncbi:ArgE/DapE family deacylase [Pseudomaricurvus alkylphenolicus]|uniref:ArgE/DapE family deacylase n=1 Tax=Pseudomaricurvus alkylphenolicus TaxID=1306991 RepID=UPI00142108AE|nr:ArgE/DapE family deacylase [Pseudomaricurvus alkylphenolicus]NIB45221.1 ArgE/DapE family deacylase [Pseudomaricurvus alkylphenolicus]